MKRQNPLGKEGDARLDVTIQAALIQNHVGIAAVVAADAKRSSKSEGFADRRMEYFAASS